MAKRKFASISLTVRDRAISSKVSTHRVSEHRTLGNLKKVFPPQKWRPFWIFDFLRKMAKHEFASISLTVWDRAISSKLSTHRVSEQCTLCNFQKFSSSHIWRPFWIFEFLPKMAKHKIDSISEQCTLCNFQKFSSSHIWRPFWIFEFWPKIEKQKFASIFLIFLNNLHVH